MAALYPNLKDRFEREGLCPICLLEMELSLRYMCENGHVLCCRCKPYYYRCPTCQATLHEEIPPVQMAPHHPPPPTHFMPHPYPPYPPMGPSAPPVDDFQRYEKHAWLPPMPTEDQELRNCSYTHLGCFVRVPEHLQELHESRCQFRPHLEEEHLPTDLNRSEEELIECKYRVVGCNVQTTPWRISIHEKYCVFKDRYEAMTNLTEDLDAFTIAGEASETYGDPEELVECKYRKYGCMVNMPRRRKVIHEEKCNYSKYHQEEDTYHSTSSEGEYDPDEQIECRWAEHGCRVRPKRSRQPTHEEKCNYRMEECSFGCGTLFQPARKFAHERTCHMAN